MDRTYIRIANLSVLLLCILISVWMQTASTSGEAGGDRFDLVIKNGRVLDGSGNPWFYADIGIIGDRIAAVGRLRHMPSKEVIDVSGLYVAPGFIDVHSHAGPGLSTRELSAARPLISQGITAVVINHDGGGETDLSLQHDRLTADGLGVNVIQLIPHGSIRTRVMGNVNRSPTAADLEEMKNLVRQGMQYGAFGLSTGLFYVPGYFSGTDEIIELAQVVAGFGGIHASHIRDESDYNIGVVAAVDEIIHISEKAGLPGVVSHIKTLGPGVWGYSGAVVQRINEARENGIEIYADQYPYNASATSLSAALIPSSYREGSLADLRWRIRDTEQLDQIRNGIALNLERRGGADRILIRQFRENRTLEGKTLQQISDSLVIDPVDAVIQLMKAGSPGIISFNMHDDDVNRFMQQSWTMTSSDGALVSKDDEVPHPRAYGPFPRKIRKYVKDDGVIDLETAIRSMTSLPATAFRIPNRGWIRPGSVADIVVFDPDRIRDLATYTEPHQLSEGMVHVLIGGKFALRDGDFTGTLHGRVLRKPADEFRVADN